MDSSTTNTWSFLDTGSHDAFFNMAVDEVLLSRMKEQDARPVLRFYTWSRPSITIGYFQKVVDEFNLRDCESRGWNVVRRLTGGRAVFHHQELTYSILLPRSAPGAGGSVLESYRMLSNGLLNGLRLLGLDVELVSFHKKRQRRQRAGGRSPNCFDSPSWYEITVGGKKLVGSAQRRMSYGILQQGSILISMAGQREFNEVLQRSTDKKRKKTGEGMTSITDILKGFHETDLLKESLIRGFRKALGVEFLQTKLTRKEWKETGRLGRERYRSQEWNWYGKS
ncbi:MAG: lipoate--protein ligase family protein [Deltaproteobacteria bacterium]|nr:lipoate--protein ligase family protein [Deltaproteobacteria bacterium]